VVGDAKKEKDLNRIASLRCDRPRQGGNSSLGKIFAANSHLVPFSICVCNFVNLFFLPKGVGVKVSEEMCWAKIRLPFPLLMDV
jgi:hypothetical protein